jgi:hypothetical protein
MELPRVVVSLFADWDGRPGSQIYRTGPKMEGFPCRRPMALARRYALQQLPREVSMSDRAPVRTADDSGLRLL